MVAKWSRIVRAPRTILLYCIYASVLKSWSASGRRAARSAVSARTETVGVGLLSAFECCEAVAQANLKITSEGIVAGIDDFCCRCAALNVGTLSEDVIGFQADRHGLAFEELV